MGKNGKEISHLRQVFLEGTAKKRLVGAKGKGQLLQELAEFL